METVREKERRSLFVALFIFTVLAAGIGTIGYLFYSNYEKNFRVGVENQLASIADMKVSGLVQWKKERLGDMSVFYRNTSFFGLVQRYLEHPDDIEGQKQMVAVGALGNRRSYRDRF